MNHPAWHVLLAAAALVAGHAAYGWPGVALGATATVFWWLLQFTRAVRAMRRAGDGPIGQVPSAVMLHARLNRGMTMLQVLPIAGSLGEAVGPAVDATYRWHDAGGRVLTAVFVRGRLASWRLDAESLNPRRDGAP